MARARLLPVAPTPVGAAPWLLLAGCFAPPVALPTHVATREDVPVVAPLQVEGVDDVAGFTFVVTTPAGRGDAVVEGARLVYTPAPDVYGVDRVGFVAIDATGIESEEAVVTVAVEAVDDAPVADALTGEALAGTPATMALAARDPDGDQQLRYAIATPPSHGTATIAAAVVTYVADTEFEGLDTFTYVAIDPAGLESEPASVKVTVTGLGDIPTATALTATGDEDTVLVFTLAATDPDGDAITFALDTLPTVGVATLDGATVTYTPPGDWNGEDALTFTASDATGTSAPATATLVVVPVNDPPTVADASSEAAPGTPATIVLPAADIDGDALTCIVRRAPEHGSLTVDGCVATYTATDGFEGEDSFTYFAEDAESASDRATVVLTVEARNHVPTAAPIAVATDEDVAVDIPLVGNDVDGDTLTYTLVSAPASGAVTLAAGVATYTPAPDESGTVTFDYVVTDPLGEVSAPATVTVTVAPVPDAPVAAALSVSTPEDTPVLVTPSATDADGDTTFTWAVSLPPSHGSATVVGNYLRYTPAADWSGADSFGYTATDPSGLTSAAGVVTVAVSAGDDPPVADDLTLTVDEDDRGTVTLSGTDPEGAALTYSLASAPAHGTVTLSGRRATYTPDVTYVGADAFTFLVSDGAQTDEGTVTIEVVEANAPPTATPLSVTGTEDEPLTITLYGDDPDGDPLTWAIVGGPSVGTATIRGRTITYTPRADWAGRDELRYTVSDGYESSGAATVRITYTPVDDAPVATDATVETEEDRTVTFRLRYTDVDGGSDPTFDTVTSTTHGRLMIAGAFATYTPEDDWSGTDELTFTATSDGLVSEPATVTLEVAPVDDPPVALASTGHTTPGETVALTAVWSDVDSEGGTFALDEDAAYGAVVVTDTGFEYTPPEGWFGADSFVWHAETDGQAGDPVLFRVNVHPPALFDRPPMPQVGLNKIQFALGADPGDVYSAEEQFWPETIFADFEDLGVQFFRQGTRGDVVWSTVQLGEGYFTEDAVNAEILATPDVEPSGTLFEIQYASPTPPWWDADQTFQKEMGDDAYAYLDVVAADYGESVRSFEIGNEMYHWVAADPPVEDDSDLPACYPEDGFSPEEQGVFIEQAARYLRAADPDAVITLASINSAGAQSEDWLRGVVEGAEETDWFDIVSYHSYDSWQRALNTRVGLDALLGELGVTDRLVRLTEMGSSSDADYTARTDYPNSDESQSADVFRLALIGLGGGDATVVWHTYLPVTDAEGGEFQGFELVEYDGTWKPAAYAFQLFTHTLLPMRQVTPLEPGQDRYAFRVVTTDDAVRYVVWGLGTWTVPEGMTEATSVYPDKDGVYTWVPVTEGDDLALTDTPILLR